MGNPSELGHGRDMASPRSCCYWPHGQGEGSEGQSLLIVHGRGCVEDREINRLTSDLSLNLLKRDRLECEPAESRSAYRFCQGDLDKLWSFNTGRPAVSKASFQKKYPQKKCKSHAAKSLILLAPVRIWR